MERPFDLITFDFDGVLLHNDHNERFLQHCHQLELRWPVEQERKLWRFIHDYFGSATIKEDYKKYGPNDFWFTANRRFLAALSAQGDLDRAAVSLTQRLQTEPGGLAADVFKHDGRHRQIR